MDDHPLHWRLSENYCLLQCGLNYICSLSEHVTHFGESSLRQSTTRSHNRSSTAMKAMIKDFIGDTLFV